MSWQTEAKKRAAQKIVAHIESGMVIGIGSGSTAAEGIRVIGEKIISGELENIKAVPTSYQAIQEAVKELPQNSYCVIPFEKDLFSLYQLFDVYVHTPINPTLEAFGQTYVEALAAGIPSVFTMSGVAPQFVLHEH